MLVNFTHKLVIFFIFFYLKDFYCKMSMNKIKKKRLKKSLSNISSCLNKYHIYFCNYIDFLPYKINKIDFSYFMLNSKMVSTTKTKKYQSFLIA